MKDANVLNSAKTVSDKLVQSHKTSEVKTKRTLLIIVATVCPRNKYSTKSEFCLSKCKERFQESVALKSKQCDKRLVSFWKDGTVQALDFGKKMRIISYGTIETLRFQILVPRH